jgi:hypothetical protein
LDDLGLTEDFWQQQQYGEDGQTTSRFEQLGDSEDIDWRFSDFETVARDNPLMSNFGEDKQKLPSKAPEQKLGTSQSFPRKPTPEKHADTKWEYTFVSPITIQHKGSQISRKQGSS